VLVTSNNRLQWRPRASARISGGGAVTILPEPHVLLTAAAKVPGLDGARCRSRIGNTIGMREEPDVVARSCAQWSLIRRGFDAPIRATRRNCPVWDLHKIYSDDATRACVNEGCVRPYRCLDCKPARHRQGGREVTNLRSAPRNSKRIRAGARYVAEGATKRAMLRGRHWMKCAGRCTASRVSRSE